MSIESFSAPMIATAVYVCVELLKRFLHRAERYKRWYPVMAAVLGILLGIAAYLTGFVEIAADDVAGAAFVGLCSGLCATGTDQLIQQLIRERNAQKTTAAPDAEPPKDNDSVTLSASGKNGKEE